MDYRSQAEDARMRRLSHLHHDSTTKREEPSYREEKEIPELDKLLRRHRTRHDSDLEESDFFFIDRRGDPQNIQYGSIHRSNIPAYRRVGYGTVIGCSPIRRIDNSISTDKQIYLKATEDTRSKTASKLLTSKHGKASHTKYKFIIPVLQAKDALEGDYIEFERPSKRRRTSLEQDGASALFAYPDYRSIEGKAKVTNAIDDGLVETASDSGADDGAFKLERVAREENSRLLRAARASPLDVGLWFELAAHQSEVVHTGLDAALLTASERRSLAELRLSILDEASKRTPKDHVNHGALLIKIMEEGALIWDKVKLDSKWNDALLSCPNDITLFVRFLNYVQSDPHAFNFEKCRSAYLRCFHICKEMVNDMSDVETRATVIHLLMRFISFTRDAGFDETANATWQAILEFHFFHPPNISNATISEAIESFEQFWESDTPKIGEEGATGWAKMSSMVQQSRTQSSRRPLRSVEVSDRFDIFAEEELRLSATDRLPAAADDDEANANDLFRFVMFDDIKDVVILLQPSVCENILLGGFLASYGLPLMTCDGISSNVIASITDPFIPNYHIPYRNLESDFDSHKQRLLTSDRQIQSVWTLFEDGFKVFKDRLVPGLQSDQDLILFIDRCLNSLMSASPTNDSLAEYVIAWKLHMFPESAQKTAKRLLKNRPSSLRLYNAYALVETALGRFGKAKEVWSTASKMHSNLSADLESDVVLLWHSSMRSHARRDDEQGAIIALFTIVDGTSEPSVPSEVSQLSASQQLRTAQALKSGFDHRLVSNAHGSTALFADCLAWLEYLKNKNISSVLTIYKHYESKLVKKSHSNAAEQLIQYKVSLLGHHLSRKRPFVPAVWVEDLEDCLSRYPSNVAILNLYVQLASYDRLRTITKAKRPLDLTKATVIEWHSRIVEELRRTEFLISSVNINTIRAMLRKALIHPDSVVKHSTELWIIWLQIELHYACSREDSSQVDVEHHTRQVFLDGFRHLPWIKSWAMLGMKLFGRGGMDQSELKHLYEALEERGLRFRHSLHPNALRETL